MKRFLMLVALSSGCVAPEMQAPQPRVASSMRLTLECARRTVFAWNADRTMNEGGRVPCTVFVADRFGQPLDGVKVSLFTEAGTLTASEGVTAGGKFSTELVVSAPAPRDVAPVRFEAPVTGPVHTGAPVVPAWMVPNSWPKDSTGGNEPRRPDPLRPNVINNPRDNLVTLIAVVDGEEGFADDNANAFRDSNEAFEDLTEPFVDSDDDGTRGDGESFVDANGNGTWDGKNLSWDSTAKIWATAYVVWTGLPDARDVRSPQGSTAIGAGAFVELYLGMTAGNMITLSDPWLNGFTRLESDVCTLTVSDARVELWSTTLGAPTRQEEVGRVVHAVTIRDMRPPGMPGTDTGEFPARLNCTFSEPARSFSFDLFTVRLL